MDRQDAQRAPVRDKSEDKDIARSVSDDDNESLIQLPHTTSQNPDYVVAPASNVVEEGVATPC
jgi:hypothetical protein